MTKKIDDRMAPWERKRVTLREMRVAQGILAGDPYLDVLETKSDEERAESMQRLQDLTVAILILKRAGLAAIGDDLKANEAALGRATADMATALQTLTKTRQILDTVGTVLGIVGRIVKLL